MSLDSGDIDSIRKIFEDRADRTDAKMDKMETKIFDEIEKVSLKVDDLAANQQISNDRVTRLETNAAIMSDSRLDQGRRLGEAEKAITIMQAHSSGQKETAARAGNWVQWVVPVLLTIIAGICGFIVGS